MPNCKITNEAYELLEMWCEKVDDIEERAKLSIRMLEFVQDGEDADDDF